MYRSGHIGVALMFAAVTVGISPTPIGFALAFLILATERIPDFDLRTELLSHRGFSHTVWFALGVAVLFGGVAAVVAIGGNAYLARFEQVSFVADIRAIYPAPSYLFVTVATGTFVGMASHLVADFLTVGEGKCGVQPLWPVWPTYEVPIQLCRADSYVANFVLLGLGVITAAVVVYIRVPVLG